jgi:hypothetical protein
MYQIADILLLLLLLFGFYSRGKRLKELLQSFSKAYLLQGQGHRALIQNHGQHFLMIQNLNQL